VKFTKYDEKHSDGSVVFAALNYDFKKFVSFLNAGADFNQKDEWDKFPITSIEQKINDIKNDNPRPDIKESKNLENLELKRTLLQLYKEGEVIMEDAEQMWSWVTIECQLIGLNNLVLAERGRNDNHVEEYTFCVAKVSGGEKTASPEKDFGKSVYWTEGEFVSTLTYNMESENSPEICFEVFKGAVIVNFPRTTNVKIGTWKDNPHPTAPNKLIEFKKQLFKGNFEKLVNDHILKSNQRYIENGARIELKLRIRRADESFKHEKKKYLARVIDALLDRLEKLKDNLETDIFTKLDFSLKRPCNFSLLSAAIISEDEKVVGRLINLGANPALCFTSSLIPLQSCSTSSSIPLENFGAFFYGSSVDLVKLLLREALPASAEALRNIESILMSSDELKLNAEAKTSERSAENKQTEGNNLERVNEDSLNNDKPLGNVEKECLKDSHVNGLVKPVLERNSSDLRRKQLVEQLYPISDFQSVYVKIFTRSVALRNDLCWSCVSSCAFGDTVIFKSPGENFRHYLPEGHGGQLHNNTWYYVDIKRAKLVAFCVFLNTLTSEGILADPQHTLDGKLLWNGELKLFSHNIKKESDVAFL